MKGPLREDRTRISTRSSVKHLRRMMQSIQDLNARPPFREGLDRISMDLHKIFPEGPVHVMQGHPEDFTHNVLCKITRDSISPGCPQDIFTGTCTRSCNDLLDDFSRITRSSQKDLYMGGFSARFSHMELCRS